MAVPSAAPAGLGTRLLRGTKAVGRFAWNPLRMPVKGAYHLMGGGLINLTAKGIYKGFSAIGEGFRWSGNKVNEGGHYSWGFTKSAIGGAFEAGPRALLSFPIMNIPRDIWMSLYGVGSKTLGVYGQTIMSPINFGRGFRQMIFGNPEIAGSKGLFGRPVEIAKNLATFQFREAINNTLSMRPLQMLKLWNFGAVSTATRSLVSDIFAPIHRPVTPILEKTREVLKVALESKTQHWDSMKRFGEHFRNGIGQIMESHNLGKTHAYAYRLKIAEELAIESEEKEAIKAEKIQEKAEKAEADGAKVGTLARMRAEKSAEAGGKSVGGGRNSLSGSANNAGYGNGKMRRAA